jgi:hypothetical protein
MGFSGTTGSPTPVSLTLTITCSCSARCDLMASSCGPLSAGKHLNDARCHEQTGTGAPFRARKFGPAELCTGSQSCRASEKTGLSEKKRTRGAPPPQSPEVRAETAAQRAQTAAPVTPESRLSLCGGGEGGMRPPDTVTRMPHFECFQPPSHLSVAAKAANGYAPAMYPTQAR